jgi:hypothetical protein
MLILKENEKNLGSKHGLLKYLKHPGNKLILFDNSGQIFN